MLIFRPSSAFRWASCAASLQYKDDSTNDAAEEGTLAHACAEALLNNKPIPADVPEDMLELVHEYVSYVQMIVNGYVDQDIPVQLHVERYLPDGRFPGTPDVVIETPDHLEVIDLKYGQYCWVSPVKNDQLMIYGRAARTTQKRITMHVYQPRMGNIDWWTCDAKTLDDHHNLRLVPAVERAMLDEPEHTPGLVQCAWCPAQFCPALFKVFKDFVMEPEDKAYVLEHASALRKFIEQVEEAVRNGEPAEGFHTIPGQERTYLLPEAQKVLANNPDCWQDKIAPIGILRKVLTEDELDAISEKRRNKARILKDVETD